MRKRGNNGQSISSQRKERKTKIKRYRMKSLQVHGSGSSDSLVTPRRAREWAGNYSPLHIPHYSNALSVYVFTDGLFSPFFLRCRLEISEEDSKQRRKKRRKYVFPIFVE